MPTGYGDRIAKKAFPFSFQELNKFAATDPHRLFLGPLAFSDMVWFFEDFLGDTIDLNNWIAAETGTGTTFSIPATALVNGAAVMVTGGTDNNVETAYGHRVWAGDNNCGMQIRMKSDVIDANALETGFVDDATNKDVPIVSDVDTPALAGGSSNLALLHYDTDQTLTTMAFVTDGGTSNMNTTAQTLSPVFTPTAATYHRYQVGIAGDIPFARIDGIRPTSTTTGVIGHRTEGGTLVRPWICVRTRAGAAVTVHVDYVALWQDRAVRTA